LSLASSSAPVTVVPAVKSTIVAQAAKVVIVTHFPQMLPLRIDGQGQRRTGEMPMVDQPVAHFENVNREMQIDAPKDEHGNPIGSFQY
jgi:hypothetical protein